MSSVSAKDISDCVGVWLSYLQMLNGLCSAGSRLSQGLHALLGSSQGHIHATPMAAHCRNMWDDLARVTAATTAAVKGGIISALQDSALRINNPDACKSSEIGDVACASLSTFINMQYQFCMTCCECLRGVKMSGRIGEPREDCSLSSCRPSLTPNQVCQQRRWSEEVAPKGRSASVPDAADTGPRRWSMPWEGCGFQNMRLSPSVPGVFPSPLPLITATSGGAPPREASHRSGSTTPDSMWQGSSLASMEDLQGVIHLLSCQPNTTLPNYQVTHLHQPSQHVPGVTLTSCALSEKDVPSSWEWGIEAHGPSAAPKCTSCTDDTLTCADEDPGRIMSSSQGYVPNMLRPSSFNRVPPGPLNLPGLHPWCEGDGTCTTSNMGSSSGWMGASTDGGGLSRKSSSSTDSSAHSRSAGSDGSAENRSHLYCMWKGEAPFIQLTESLVEGETVCESGRQACSVSRLNTGKLEEEFRRVGDSHTPVVQPNFGEERITCPEEDAAAILKDRT